MSAPALQTIYLKNLELFLQRFPEYQELIENESKKRDSISDITIELTNRGGAWRLLEGEKVMGSLSHIISMPEFKTPARILLTEGFGLGELVDQILRLEIAFDDLIIVEPSLSRFILAMHCRDLQSILSDTRIHLIVGKNPEETFADFFSFLRPPERAFRMSASEFIVHPFYQEQYRDYFERIEDEWKAARRQIHRQYGYRTDSLLGFENVIGNLELIETTPGLKNLEGAFPKLPAVIVSTGPSLTRSLQKLKRIQNRAIIIAADASLKILLENGITPHFVACLERDEGSLPFFDGVEKYFGEHKPNLVVFPVVSKKVITAFKGPRWMVYRDYGYFQYFEEQSPKGVLSSSSSTAHFCLRIADFLGCHSAFLIGQDLSYDPDDFRSHPAGISYSEWSLPQDLKALEEKLKALNEKLVWVQGNTRAQVPTRSTYFSWMKEFSWEVQKLKVNVVNSTEGGARIPNLPWVSFEDVVQRDWPEVPDLFEGIARKHQLKELKQLKLKPIETYLKEFTERAIALKNHSESFRGLVDLPEDTQSAVVATLRVAQEELMKDMHFVSLILQNAGWEFLDIENEWALIPDKDPKFFEQRLDVLKSWFTFTSDLGEGLLKILSASRHD